MDLLSASNTNDGFSKFFEYALTSDGARRALAEASHPETIKALMQLPWMEWEKPRGVGLVPAFNDKGTDDAFKAVSGVMGAALARRKELESGYEAMTFIFPTVIVDGQLFECNLDVSGEIQVKPISEARLCFPMHFREQQGTCVHITTAENLPRFAEAAAHALSELQKFFAPQARRLFDDYAKASRRAP